MLEQLCMLRDFETRSVCSENKTGEKGMGGRTSAKDGVAAREMCIRDSRPVGSSALSRLPCRE